MQRIACRRYTNDNATQSALYSHSNARVDGHDQRDSCSKFVISTRLRRLLNIVLYPSPAHSTFSATLSRETYKVKLLSSFRTVGAFHFGAASFWLLSSSFCSVLWPLSIYHLYGPFSRFSPLACTMGS